MLTEVLEQRRERMKPYMQQLTRHAWGWA